VYCRKARIWLLLLLLLLRCRPTGRHSWQLPARSSWRLCTSATRASSSALQAPPCPRICTSARRARRELTRGHPCACRVRQTFGEKVNAALATGQKRVELAAALKADWCVGARVIATRSTDADEARAGRTSWRRLHRWSSRRRPAHARTAATTATTTPRTTQRRRARPTVNQSTMLRSTSASRTSAHGRRGLRSQKTGWGTLKRCVRALAVHSFCLAF
jgi:hypothetical protein